MTLNGYDISSNNKDKFGEINATKVAGDFAIIKATEGLKYVNQYCNQDFGEAQSSGKKIGLYHFAAGNDPVKEANYFINAIKNYVGKAVLFLDLEKLGNVDIMAKWQPTGAKKFLDEVYRLTGVRPIIYMGLADENKYDWSSVAKNYAGWIAQYNNNNKVNGYAPRNLYGNLKHFKSMAMFQYTSNGRLSGFDGPLDLNVFYGDKTAWDKFAKANGSSAPSKPSTSPSKPAPKPANPSSWVDALGDKWISQKGTFTLNTAIKMRSGAKTSSNLISVLPKGTAVKYDAYSYHNGYVWIRQPRSKRYGYLPTGEAKGTKRTSSWGTFK